jgi:hypothetical protein
MSWWWAPDLSGQHDAEVSNDQHYGLQIKFSLKIYRTPVTFWFPEHRQSAIGLGSMPGKAE